MPHENEQTEENFLGICDVLLYDTLQQQTLMATACLLRRFQTSHLQMSSSSSEEFS